MDIGILGYSGQVPRISKCVDGYWDIRGRYHEYPNECVDAYWDIQGRYHEYPNECADGYWDIGIFGAGTLNIKMNV